MTFIGYFCIVNLRERGKKDVCFWYPLIVRLCQIKLYDVISTKLSQFDIFLRIAANFVFAENVKNTFFALKLFTKSKLNFTLFECLK